MNTNRIGCLTGNGIITGILTLAVVAGIAIARGGILFLPGALNAQAGQELGGVSSHAEIGGRCKQCHAPFWGRERMADRCVVCHADLPAERQDPTSLHRILAQYNPQATCRTCHTDHLGPDSELTASNSFIFPHEVLGYSLAGHVQKTDRSDFQCKDCHTVGYRQFDQAVCQTCHQQVNAAFVSAHLEAFGNNCLACHYGIDTYGPGFDHDRYAFPLTGKHGAVACAACHENARSIADLRSAPSACFACHGDQDPHEGRFGTDCGACHTPAGWTPADFNHDLAAFKLDGQHIGVACDSCHVNNVFRGTPMDCFACHAAKDAHQGRFGTNCAACHTTAGWLPATFDHNLSAFALTGKHAQVACEACHAKNVFAGTPTDCYACHRKDDAHSGQYGTACGACHTPNGWTPASFDHSRFPLTNGHAGLACTRCHSGGVFAGLSTACSVCHAVPPYHAGLFTGMACNQCHNTSAWSPAGFPLAHPGGCEGNCLGHQGASCRDCHTSSLSVATCTKCHDSNKPGDNGGND
jgi:hypothetical protein